MKIDKVTITGADDKILYTDLLNLQEDFPFVEWGILFSGSKEGTPRYPSKDHREKHFTGALNLSAHFCGWWSRQVLEERNFQLISDLPPQYKRVQLNYSFLNAGDDRNLRALNIYLTQHEDRRIILQYNHNNMHFIDEWMRKNNLSSRFHFLYDASGGRGKQITRILPAIGGHYTGHAGGIDVDNVDSVCCEIGRQESKEDVWIDLESGARTNNNFDLEKVRSVLQKCSYHIKYK